MTLPSAARIVEVGPRDGLQNEKRYFDIGVRTQLINMLADAGISHIEAGSFVSPKWVPQMANSDQVFTGIERRSDTFYIALVPNLQGFELAVQARANEVAIFTSASEAFAQKNTNCSIAENLARFSPILTRAKQVSIPVRGYVSCIAGCPYEGDIEPEAVANLAAKLIAMGCYEISLGDTIGSARPEQTAQILKAVIQQVPVEKLAVHFHDTNGRALDNIRTALEFGVTVIDSAIAGLGGCPYAEGASGNVASESVIALLNELNIEHGIDLTKLLKASDFIQAALSKTQ
ncbi:hydroxymethylglutaryl-CoA lyase [Zhongshania aquimaris]|uniref:Hydroxymethylglutaryl-CoA lyase n=1 Tax=Zhongshania aquimaris TaxID=2857107 RepID=A0ABS6VTW6_9GAMM|nr:hydroxymethylglutaryl-CoA lyase [Zhongshania aquimaris]MBW2941764.1 hydroxymethylglutaryl-CoA lyase [Zhongshania aquimaris]